MDPKGKTVLGKGLGALISGIGTAPVGIRDEKLPGDDGRSTNVLASVDVKRVLPNRFQARTDFDQEKLEELKASILENGVIQPITVRRQKDGMYEIIAGERRLRASVLTGLERIPAYIMDVTSDAEMLELALVENLQREDLNAIEEAHSYERLITECSLTHEEIAKKLGRDRSTISNVLRLLKLPSDIQESIRRNEISAGHARALINLPSEEAQLKLWKKTVQKGLSVRQVELFAHSSATGEKKKKKQGVILQYDGTTSALESRLKRLLGTQVRIHTSRSGNGSIVIEFYSAEDLGRIVDLLEEIRR
ncbi:MAG: DNA-binding protein [Ignavibacteriales bacterium CG07_land_8_20_14_0_80_59_12]|nr:MAG: DNA-binding protein [Ignavibacteriales bacterium CG07_land_8_20_14_0_80_59_12]